jgi:hypothetical protein
MVMPSLHRALALALVLATGVAAGTKDYVPRVDPHEPVPESGVPIVWRGDTMHPRPLAGAPDEGPWVFHVDDFRWTFLSPTPERPAWEPVFVPARIDLSRVRKLSMIWSPFFPDVVAGHTALLIEFEDEHAVRRLGEAADRTDVPAVATGVVLSVEARMKQGEKYGFSDGLRGKFPLVYSLSTYANYKQRCLDVYQGELHRWDLELDEVEAKAVAQAALKATLRDHRGETYWLTRRSCSTEFMDILITGLERAEDLTKALRRGDDVAGLRQSLSETRRADLDAAEAEGKSILGHLWSAGGAVLHAVNPARWFGFTRDRVRRTTPLGIFVNPAMSLPAQLPGVLARRGLLDSSDPDEVMKYEPPPPAASPVPEAPDYQGLRRE